MLEAQGAMMPSVPCMHRRLQGARSPPLMVKDLEGTDFLEMLGEFLREGARTNRPEADASRPCVDPRRLLEVCPNSEG